MEIIEGKLYKTPEAAKILAMHEKTLKLKIKEGKIKCIPHAKFEHYRIMGIELKRLLGL